MILVILGTQDKQFQRLLKAVERQIELGNIKEKVIVQAGQTKYQSDKMEILDLLPEPEFDKLMDKADLIITHGGAGTILSAIKKGKKVIAASRLKKYKEHHNDHQKQIIKEFANQGYILELKDFNKLDQMLEKSRSFKPRKFISNTDNMIKKISDYIEKDNHTSWLNNSGFIFKYFFISLIYLLIVLGIRELLKANLDSKTLLNTMNLLRWNFIPYIIIMYFINRYYVFKDKKISKGRFIGFFPFYLLFTIFTYMIGSSEVSGIPFYASFFIITLLFNRYIIFGNLVDTITDLVFGREEDEAN